MSLGLFDNGNGAESENQEKEETESTDRKDLKTLVEEQKDLVSQLESKMEKIESRMDGKSREKIPEISNDSKMEDDSENQNSGIILKNNNEAERFIEMEKEDRMDYLDDELPVLSTFTVYSSIEEIFGIKEENMPHSHILYGAVSHALSELSKQRPNWEKVEKYNGNRNGFRSIFKEKYRVEEIGEMEMEQRFRVIISKMKGKDEFLTTKEVVNDIYDEKIESSKDTGYAYIYNCMTKFSNETDVIKSDYRPEGRVWSVKDDVNVSDVEL